MYLQIKCLKNFEIMDCSYYGYGLSVNMLQFSKQKHNMSGV